MMHADLCIPVTVCQEDQITQLTSSIILSNTQETLHLAAWSDLEEMPDVNHTYNNTTDTNYICFHNVMDSFLFLEYCEETRMNCTRDSSFCCHWLEFVKRTCVNVNGSKYIVKFVVLNLTFSCVLGRYRA